MRRSVRVILNNYVVKDYSSHLCMDKTFAQVDAEESVFSKDAESCWSLMESDLEEMSRHNNVYDYDMRKSNKEYALECEKDLANWINKLVG